MIRHLFDTTIHRTALDHPNVVTVHVSPQGARVVINGFEVMAEIGDSVSVTLKNSSASTLRHNAVLWNSAPEVTSEPSRKRKTVKRRKSRYFDPDAPLDTPSLDTSFHDHEMDV